MSLLPANVHQSWKDFLSSDILNMLEYIENQLVEDFSPDRQKVLRFLETDQRSLKIVILGQDPYPEKGKATGRAFEVGGLNTWNEPFRQVSLKNIVRLIYKAQKGIEVYDDIPKFSFILDEIKEGKFKIANPPELFENLEKQGVLFLNTYFTVYPGKPLSHTEIWRSFTENLLLWLSNQNPQLIWFLWGKNAQAFKSAISNGKFYESRHPMMCSKMYQHDFLKSDCIIDTQTIVNWLGS
ncbi:MAG: uracil-DNA glycosylase [Acetivibrionales bacterium]|jgi:uracil-DNA glycosylase|nr:uracil-DNA glycosylase [Clostridiaceae bacterium]